ncbi:MAG: hypothetical protein ACRENQ_11335 [Gemmatimonadaceae bacterium]
MLLAGAAPLQAQSQAAYRARVQALVPVWRSVTAEARRLDSIRARQLPTDTIHVGALSAVTEPGLAGLAREAASRTLVKLTPWFGDDMSDVRSQLFVLVPARSMGKDHPAVDFGEVDGTGKLVSVSPMDPTVENLAESWAMRASEILTRKLGPAFGTWLANAIPVDSPSTETWVGVRIDLVTSTFQVSRQCYAGDVRACERALGIVDDSNPIRDWFTPSERQAIIYGDRYQLRPAQPKTFDQCIAHDDDAACLALGTLIPPRQLTPPLGPASRQSLASLAMMIGGPQSYGRMASVPHAVQDQLEAAAGVSADALVRVWRASVLTTKAENTTMTPGLAIMSLFWVTACGALALGNSRWR